MNIIANNQHFIKETKSVTETDLKYGILVLSPKKFELLSKYKGQKIWIKDNLGCEAFLLNSDAKDSVLRFSGLKKWYKDRNLKKAAEMNILFDENELQEDLHVIRIEYVTGKKEEREGEHYTHSIKYDVKYEKDLEYIIKNNPDCIENNLKLVDQQGRMKAGILDLLFVDSDNNYVVVELKNKKTSDEAVGQISRYIGCIKKDIIKDENAKVRGIILTPEYDENLEYAASTLPDVEVKYFQFCVKIYNEKKIIVQ